MDDRSRKAGAPSPAAAPGAMREDWDRRAREDHKLHIATGHAGSEEEFLASGLQDLEGVVLDGISLSPSAETLEIGCGVGRLLLPLAKRVGRARGVDISPVMVEKSRAYTAGTRNVEVAVTDGTLADLPDGSMDFVFSFIVFQHIPERAPIRRYVEESARVLKPGGIFRFQVDGRWWWRHEKGRPDTYNGLKFSPRDARALLEGTPFSIVDEWGADGHYYWITARKPGAGASVSFRGRDWDAPLLHSLLRRLGSERPEQDADGIRRGTASFRPRLLALVDRLSGADDAAFVLEAYRALLGDTRDEAGRAFHEAILRKRFEDRAALLDTITTSRGFLDLVRPHVPPVPWFVACEILMRLGLPPRPATYFDLVDRALEGLGKRAGSEAVKFSFRTILGYEPDEAGLAHHRALAEGRLDGTRLMIRELLASREAPAPPLRGDGGAPRLPGESAAGEAERAVRLLEEGRDEGDREFIRLAYRGTLGRDADAGGEEFYLGKIASGELSRAGLVRELLWCEEARDANAAPRA